MEGFFSDTKVQKVKNYNTGTVNAIRKKYVYLQEMNKKIKK